MMHSRNHPQSQVESHLEGYPLRRAAYDRAESERRLTEAVAEARSRGVSWEEIGSLIGMPMESARRTYRGLRRAS